MTAFLKHCALLILVLSSILLSGCVTDCEQWGSRTVTVNRCARYSGSHCAYYTTDTQTQQYCVRRKGQPAASPGGGYDQAAINQRTQEIERERAEAALKEDAERKALTPEKIGVTGLNAFWQSLVAVSRHPGVNYGKAKQILYGPMDFKGSDPKQEAERNYLRGAVWMRFSTEDEKYKPMSHELNAGVYRAHSQEAAVAYFETLKRIDRSSKIKGVERIKTSSLPGVSHYAQDYQYMYDNTRGRQRYVYMQRGPYVVVVTDNSTIGTKKDRPAPDKNIPLPDPVSVEAVAKVIVGAFPAD